MWGFFQNRGYYQFTNGFTTQTATNDGTGSALASFLLGLAGREAAPGRHPADAVAPVVRRRFRAGQFPTHAATPRSKSGLRYEFMSPLRDIRYANTNLTFVRTECLRCSSAGSRVFREG